MSPEIFQSLLQAVVLAVVSLIAFVSRRLIVVGEAYLRSKIGNSQFEMLKAFGSTMVKSLEQNPAFAQLDGAHKKELAILSITQYAKDHNLPVDSELIDKIIEAAVQEMNSQMIGVLTEVVGE